MDILFGSWLPPLGVLVLLALLAFFLNPRKKSRSYRQRAEANFPPVQIQTDKDLLAQQNDKIKQLLNAEFKACSLMNKAEFKVFRKLETLLTEQHGHQHYRLFSEVGLGAFIQPQNRVKENQDAFWLINHLRADFLIVDRFGLPVLVIEYQGSGHRINNSTDRDTRKRYACQKVGVELIEILEQFEPQYEQKISLLLNNHYNKTKHKE